MASTNTKRYREVAPGIDAVVRYTTREDGTVRVSGYLVIAQSVMRLEDIGIKVMECDTPARAETTGNYIVGRLLEKYWRTHRQAAGVYDGSTPYTSAFDSLSPAEQEQLCPTSWRSKNTIQNGLTYFRRQLLPRLDKCGRDVSGEDLQAIADELVERAVQSTRGRNDMKVARQTAAKRLSEASVLYPALQVMTSGTHDLPILDFPVLTRENRYQYEQCKALPSDVRIRFAARLAMQMDNGLTLGAVLMLTGMARTAEACAPKFGELLCMGDYTVYGVIWQSDGEARVADLKTDSGYRIIILPKYATMLIQARREYLRSQGYSDDEIDDMYACSAPKDPKQIAKPQDLSRYVRELLMEAGLTQEYIDVAEKLMRVQPDLDDNNQPNYDVAAYILRRDGCTVRCNVCGMLPDLVDAEMGHRLSRKCKEDWAAYLRRPDNWPIIAEQLERMVYDPDRSAHPMFAPIEVCAGGDMVVRTCGQTGFRIRAKGDCRVVVQAVTMEADDSVTVSSPRKVTVQSQSIPLVGQENAIIGRVHERAYYEKLIREMAGLMNKKP